MSRRDRHSVKCDSDPDDPAIIDVGTRTVRSSPAVVPSIVRARPGVWPCWFFLRQLDCRMEDVVGAAGPIVDVRRASIAWWRRRSPVVARDESEPINRFHMVDDLAGPLRRQRTLRLGAGMSAASDSRRTAAVNAECVGQRIPTFYDTALDGRRPQLPRPGVVRGVRALGRRARHRVDLGARPSRSR